MIVAARCLALDGKISLRSLSPPIQHDRGAIHRCAAACVVDVLHIIYTRTTSPKERTNGN